MSKSQCVMMYCRALVSTCFILLYSCSYSQSTSKNISLKEQQCTERLAEMKIYNHMLDMGVFWKNDSLGTNGFRKYCTSFYLLTSKVYKDVNYDFVLKHFGKGIPVSKSDKGFLYLNYITFDTKQMEPEFKEYNIQENVFFKFDANSKALLSVYKK